MKIGRPDSEGCRIPAVAPSSGAVAPLAVTLIDTFPTDDIGREVLRVNEEVTRRSGHDQEGNEQIRLQGAPLHPVPSLRP